MVLNDVAPLRDEGLFFPSKVYINGLHLFLGGVGKCSLQGYKLNQYFTNWNDIYGCLTHILESFIIKTSLFNILSRFFILHCCNFSSFVNGDKRSRDPLLSD